MRLVKNFLFVVLNMVVELWTGFFNRTSEFYDKYTETKTRKGYVMFVSLAFVAAIGITTWMYKRVYG
ncbi:hypothetical protein D7M11_35605 [Paenibacillus ginsengarvi]|uniref:Uncharacterized protein n=1 Tax=Paenibacillus ginsengarvi TaxID=400777 RepID=A0A3B0AKV7_9BACL|nr:hypothetical protein D7M11_35605 [Paenibacillus ginsengarvi]